jgi:hypothetical protein
VKRETGQASRGVRCPGRIGDSSRLKPATPLFPYPARFEAGRAPRRSQEVIIQAQVATFKRFDMLFCVFARFS